MKSILAAIALCVAIGVDAADGTNVTGWGLTKWGMNEAEVLAALKSMARKSIKAEPLKDLICLVEIPIVSIDGQPFDGRLFFDKKTRTLRKVVLNATKAVKNPESVFSSLEQKLIEKYGKPDFENDNKKEFGGSIPIDRKRAWKRGSTRIQLILLSIPNTANAFGITYEAVSPEGEKNL